LVRKRPHGMGLHFDIAHSTEDLDFSFAAGGRLSSDAKTGNIVTNRHCRHSKTSELFWCGFACC
jgi:hypothetical protein